MKTILETERLLLREYVEDDAEAFLRLNSNPEVFRYTSDGPIATVEEARAILLKFPIADYRTHGFGRWACVLRGSGEAIGFAGLKFLPETGEVDLGYRFIPEQWGRGLATEASRAVVRFGFETLRLPEITALVQLENAASVRVIQKCGLGFTGMVPYRGRVVAHYALAAQEWQAKNQPPPLARV